MKIFVSSTYEDLKLERKEAIKVIGRIGQAVAMESFFSSNHQSKPVCVAKLQECDAIVLILGFRYGHIDPEENISITEIEYNIAKSLGLPAFIFVKNPRGNKEWRTGETKASRSKKHNAFKERLDSEGFRKCFTNRHQLGTEVIGAIREYEIHHGQLGTRVSAFASPKDFFKPFSDPRALFNHSLALVGRNRYLRELKSFIFSKKRILLMQGRGGIGKSKILFEFSLNYLEKTKGMLVFFLREGIPLDADAFRQLPPQKCIIIVDDAHRRKDLEALFALSQQHSDRIKLVLSYRPEGATYIQVCLLHLGFDFQEIEELQGLAALGPKEMRELARYALGRKYQYLVESLYAKTRDCPLATVIGGQLIAKKLINPRMLERHEEFQAIVFTRFQDTVMGNVSGKISPDLCRSVLSLVSVLSPIYVADKDFQKKAASFLNIKTSTLLDAIGLLEQNGILLRRGRQLRITPDVLSDHILYNSCLTPAGDSTCYSKEIFDAFRDTMLENPLLNLAELDWRIHRSGKAIDLLADIWRVLEIDFHRSSHRMRAYMLNRFKRVAYFQPGRVLSLIEYAKRNPVARKDISPFAGLIKFEHSDVIRLLPPIIREISYSLEYLPTCCDLLWELGCDDKREVSSYSDHALRTLKDLADYDNLKPLRFNQVVLEAAERILAKPDAHEHAQSPVDILDAFLVKQGSSARSEGNKFLFTPFLVSYKKTRPIREKAMKLLIKCSKSKDPRVILRAGKSLISILNQPHGYFGKIITDQERKQWAPEQLRALKAIFNISKYSRDAVVRVSIYCDIKRHASHLDRRLVRKADEILRAIPKNFEFQIVRVLWHRYIRDWSPKGFETDHLREEREVEGTAKRFLRQKISPSKMYKILNRKLVYLRSCKIEASPGFFLGKIAELAPNKACQICRSIISHSPSILDSHFHSMLYAIRYTDEALARELIKTAVKKNQRNLCLSIIQAYMVGRWVLGDEDFVILKHLLNFPDPAVRKMSISSLKNFRGALQNKAIKLAIATDIGDDELLGEALCALFSPRDGFDPEALTQRDIKVILLKLLKINKLTDDLYHIDEFLSFITKKYPILSSSFLMKRYKFANRKSVKCDEYQPMPFEGFPTAFKGISSQKLFPKIFKEVRNLALIEGRASFWLPVLFKELSDSICQKSLNLLKGWVDSNHEERIRTVSFLLKGAPSYFVFRNPRYVKNILEKAHRKGEEVYREVRSNLYCSAISGGKTGPAGQPMPADVALEKRAEKMCAQFIVGSPSWIFFDSLRQHAQNSIRDTLGREEELFG